MELVGLGLVLVLALLLRTGQLSGLIPDFLDVDEMRTVNTSLSMIQNRTIDPLYTYYPSFGFYLNAAWYLLWGLATHGPAGALSWLDSLNDRSPELILLSRYLSLIAGLVSVTLMHFLARLYLGPRGGLLAALLLCLNSQHIAASQNAKVDIIALMMAGLAYVLMVKVVRSGKLRWYLLCAVSAALVFTTKFNYFTCFTFCLAHIGRSAHEGLNFWQTIWHKRMIAACLVLAAVLFASSPYWFFNLSENLKMFGWIYHTSTFSSFYHFSDHVWYLDRYFYNCTIIFPFIYGIIPYLAIWFGTIWFIREYRWHDLVIWPNLVGWAYMFSSQSGGSFPYYHYLNMMPVAIFILAFLPVKLAGSSKSWQRWAAVVLGLILIGSSASRVDNYHTWLFGNYDKAGPWMQQHIPADARVLLGSVYIPGDSLGLTSVETVWPQDFDEELLAEKDAEYIVLDMRAFAGFRKLYRKLDIDERVDSMLDGTHPRYRVIKTFETDFSESRYFTGLDPEHEVKMVVLKRKDN